MHNFMARTPKKSTQKIKKIVIDKNSQKKEPYDNVE